MTEPSRAFPCAFCGSCNTRVREVDVRARRVWLACLDCQRFGPQPLPDESADAADAADREPTSS
jgi:hypothetical protein